MIVALALRRACAARALEEVIPSEGARDAAGGVKVDSDELPKARRVVVAQRLGVAERFEHRVGADE